MKVKLKAYISLGWSQFFLLNSRITLGLCMWKVITFLCHARKNHNRKNYHIWEKSIGHFMMHWKPIGLRWNSLSVVDYSSGYSYVKKSVHLKISIIVFIYSPPPNISNWPFPLIKRELLISLQPPPQGSRRSVAHSPTFHFPSLVRTRKDNEIRNLIKPWKGFAYFW